jgi:FG-GAP-like repeat
MTLKVSHLRLRSPEMTPISHDIRPALVLTVALLAALVVSALALAPRAGASVSWAAPDLDGGDPETLVANAAGAAGVAFKPMFSPALEFAAGLYPHSVTSADFDGDGNPDLATANGGTNSVSVLLGDGNGSFGPNADFTVGLYPYSVTSADFDGDGNPDLATADYFSDSVSVLLGTGSGSFGRRTNFKAGDFPNSVISADLDGDGDPDLTTANYVSNNVSVLLGIGSGSFGPKTDFKVRQHPDSVTSADFDGDGNPDLATANGGFDTVSVMLGTGAPSTMITRQPKAKIKTDRKSVRAKVAFSSEDAGARFKCKLDKAAYKPCTSPYKVKAKSKPGKGKKHKISVKAKDDAGNVGEAATVKFRVIRKG